MTTKPSVTGLPQRARAVRRLSGILTRGRRAGSASRGAITARCRKRKAATTATRAKSSGQRVSSTSSLRMFWTVSKPTSGSRSPKVKSAVIAVWRKAPARPVAAEGSADILHLLDIGPTEDALRHENHHNGEDRESGHVLVGAGHILRPQRLDEADQEPAQHGTRQGTNAAEDGRREGLYAGNEAVVEAYDTVEGEVERAGDGRERGCDHECDRDRAVDVDADQCCHFGILFAGALRPAERRPAHQVPERDQEHGGDDPDGDLLVG